MDSLKTLTILFRTQNSFVKLIKKDVKKHGLNTTEFGVLEVLYHKGPLAIMDIKDKVLITASSMSYVIDQLVEKGYIKRVKNEDDKRQFMIKLTDFGEELMKEIYPKHARYLRQRLDLLTFEEEETLQHLLKKIGKE